ncbi:hypothetical protein HMI54_014246 [Coelomomyces lativittatus]|nr:hypothetical protein HMI56_005312 [Coelomomyces lativittatus]KAJ1517635.1 hypothetical protein HMI55_006464 [Coelomomyces lativittatus]KAJ1518622.1 hypothetical protein HMI54_014246 [Coelomomyces lativittatus]
MKGLTKALNRAGTTLLQATGAIEKTVDKEFDEVVRRYRSLESKLDRLHREAKGYLEALRAIALTQSRMAITLDTLYDPSAPLHVNAALYKTMSGEVETMVYTEVDPGFRQSVVDPMAYFCTLFPIYNEAISKRSKKLLDYDALRSKHRKSMEKPNDDPTKLTRLEQEVLEAKRNFDLYHLSLLQELPKIISMRISFVEPSFEAFLKSQHRLAQETIQRILGLQASFQSLGWNPDAAADRELDGAADRTLEKMRSLSICVTPL